MGEWIAATGLVLALVGLWGGSADHLRVAFIVAVSTLASIGISLDDYAHQRETNTWQHAVLVLWMLLVLMLGVVHSDDSVRWSLMCALQLATALGFIGRAGAACSAARLPSRLSLYGLTRFSAPAFAPARCPRRAACLRSRP
ncbi:hypothetical protein LP419_11655 [Massilia sp. H-1]|nr:hypothetical protein LP419_11655 [Massilia sp. H-1]